MKLADWYSSYKKSVLERAQWSQPHVRMFNLFDKDIRNDVQSLARYKAARSLALELNEDLFALLCVPYISKQLSRLNRHEERFEVLTEAVVTAREDRFRGTTPQIMVNVLLLGSMNGIDPFGYHNQIEKACAFLRSLNVDLIDHTCVFEAILTDHFTKIGQIEKAEAALVRQQEAAAAANSLLYQWLCHMNEAFLAFKKQNWSEMLRATDLSLQFHEDEFHRHAASLVTRACALMALGDSKEAGQNYRQSFRLNDEATSQQHYNFATAYWVLKDDISKAIHLRLREQEIQDELILPWQRVHSAISLCELYQRDGQPNEVDHWIQRALEFSNKLVSPAPTERKLAELGLWPR